MTPALAIGWFRIVFLTRTVSHTALSAAAWWAVFAHAVLTLAATCYLLPISEGLKSQLFHFAGVSAYCPLLGVLGARIGRQRDWSMFVVVPMITVLEWPAIAQWSRTMSGQPLDIETPAQLGMCLVIVMVTSNYLWTRFDLCAVWFASAWIWNVFRFKTPFLPSQFHLLALLQLLFWLSLELAIRARRLNDGWYGVWLDYRDHFGFVWASRLMARINEVAARDKWPWRLTAAGFQEVATAASPATTTSANSDAERTQCSVLSTQHPDSNSDPRVEQTFRWLLKPFVEPAWIDARLVPPAGDVASSPPQSHES